MERTIVSEPVFPDKSRRPTSDELAAVLGGAASWLREVEDSLAARGPAPSREWKFYSKAAGWTVAIQVRKRNVFHLLPQEGSFTVVFTLGGQAAEDSRAADLPERIHRLIADARVYAEGRSFRFDVSSRADVPSVVELARLKLERLRPGS